MYYNVITNLLWLQINDFAIGCQTILSMYKHFNVSEVKSTKLEVD